MGRRIGIITYQFSVVVKSLEKGLSDQGYNVITLDNDIHKLENAIPSTEVFILYLSDNILRDMEQVKTLLLLFDTMKDHGICPILIGSNNSREVFLKVVPAMEDHVWFERPIDMTMLIKAIEHEAHRKEREAERARSAGKKKILVIDDDPFYAKTVAAWMEGIYDVETVYDGMQGISWLAKNKADLILLDYEMPVVDGPKIFEMLGMSPETRDIPVYFLTGIGTRESVTRVMSLKPKGYLLKSTTREELLTTLSMEFDE